MSLADIRRSYERSELDENGLPGSPLALIQQWVNDAIQAGMLDPTAMTLATCNAHGQPSARTVLLKSCDGQGLVFFTNYESRKGQELAANPLASILMFWPGMERQIRAEGPVAKVTGAESDDYFHSRPLGSRIGAWASPQSRPISRDALEAKVRHYQQSLGEHPERPAYWGGYRLTPRRIEFWQGRPSRLHDRLVYAQQADGSWSLTRLAP